MASLKRFDADPKASSLPDSATAHRPASASEAGIQANKQFLPVTIISDGKLLTGNLAVAGKDENWVARVLREKHATVKNTWLLTVDKEDHILFYAKE